MKPKYERVGRREMRRAQAREAAWERKEVRCEREKGGLIGAQKSGVRQVVEDMLRFEAQPLSRPVVDEEFDRMSPLERCAETIRYNAHCVIYWLSPGGVLREWWRMWMRILCYGLAMVVPVWVLAFVAERVMMIAIYVTVTWILVGAAIAFVRAWSREQERVGGRP